MRTKITILAAGTVFSASIVASLVPTLPVPAFVPARFVGPAGHLTLYSVLAALAYMTLTTRIEWRAHDSTKAAAAFAASLVFGVILEFAQYVVPGRSPDLTDIALNTIGATFGIGLVFIVRSWRRSERHDRRCDSRASIFYSN